MESDATPHQPGPPRPFQAYVVGFLFDGGRERVVLIQKRRPAWQAGRLNGVGGKIEPGETPAEAMRREFNEEAGVIVDAWEEYARISGDRPVGEPRWRVHFFRAFDTDACHAARTRTAEQIVRVAVDSRGLYAGSAETLKNLKWLIPLALQYDVAMAEVVER